MNILILGATLCVVAVLYIFNRSLDITQQEQKRMGLAIDNLNDRMILLAALSNSVDESLAMMEISLGVTKGQPMPADNVTKINSVVTENESN